MSSVHISVHLRKVKQEETDASRSTRGHAGGQFISVNQPKPDGKEHTRGYRIAVRRGCDVDQPRNLAKSVTVE